MSSAATSGVGGGWRIGIGLAAAAFCVLVDAAWIVADLGFPHAPGAVLETDHFRYIEMARAPEARLRPELAREAPFAYRVLTPAIVRAAVALGANLHLAFYALTALALTAFLVTLWAILAACGFGLRDRLIGVALAATLPGAVRWYFYQYWMTDPLALWTVALAVLAVRMNWTALLFACAPFGVAARESFVVVLPYYAVQQLRTAGARAAALRAGALALVALGALAAVHAAVDAAPGAGWLALARDTVRWRWNNLFENGLYFATLGSFGALVVLLCAGGTVAHLRRHPEDAALALGVYASLLLARNTDRLLVYALPVLLPIALGNLRERLRAAGPRGGLLLGAVAAAQAVFFVWTQTAAVPVLSIRQPYSPVVTAALAALLVLWLWLGRAHTAVAPRAEPGEPR